MTSILHDGIRTVSHFVEIWRRAGEPARTASPFARSLPWAGSFRERFRRQPPHWRRSRDLRQLRLSHAQRNALCEVAQETDGGCSRPSSIGETKSWIRNSSPFFSGPTTRCACLKLFLGRFRGPVDFRFCVFAVSDRDDKVGHCPSDGFASRPPKDACGITVPNQPRRRRTSSQLLHQVRFPRSDAARPGVETGGEDALPHWYLLPWLDQSARNLLAPQELS